MITPTALFSDIDRCFLHPKVPAHTTIALEDALREASYKVVLLTGKHFEGVLDLEHVPYADILATSAGTEIFIRNGDTFEEHIAYAQYLSASGWDREAVVVKTRALILELQGNNIDIQFQNSDQINASTPKKKFKVSCNLTADAATVAQVEKGFLQTQSEKVMFSGSHEIEGQYKIDIVPSISGKEGAMRYIVQNILPVQKGFVAGNSGNDFGMLQEGLFPAILVGGASDEALSALEPLKRQVITPNIYSFQSKSGPQKIYLGNGMELGPLSIIHALGNPIINPEDYSLFKGL